MDISIRAPGVVVVVCVGGGGGGGVFKQRQQQAQLRTLDIMQEFAEENMIFVHKSLQKAEERLKSPPPPTPRFSYFC